ncbi:MAG: hypothetical protein Q8916_01230 [Bacteroidota bacterium]|nr:hypothetical protein [Bacteroidota bacterium]MDP4236009.1 hypothetical protein [Bacteroidota bacterium]
MTDYLLASQKGKTILREALTTGICYTTMFNALELFRAAVTQDERDAVLRLLMVVRVLGFNARFAQSFAETALEIEHATGIIPSHREALTIGMAKASKLTILTKVYFDRYHAMKVVPVIRSSEEVPSA